MRCIGYVLLFASIAPSAHAQFFDFLADWSDAPPGDNRPLIADITSTLKARSPWGELITVENGKYWRNSKGQDRFDDSYGLSTIRDRRGPVIRARIDRELRLVDIEEKRPSPDPSPPNLWGALPFSWKQSGQQKVEGLAATVRTGEDHGVSYEVWTADELGIILFVRYKTDTTVFEQRVHNIRFVEPDPKTVDFTVPTGFPAHIACWSVTEPAHDAPVQAYAPSKELCK